MSNFWDNIGQNNKQYNLRYNQNQKPNLLQFIVKNKGKTLDQMLREYNIDVSEDEIQKIIPQAQEWLKQLKQLGIK